MWSWLQWLAFFYIIGPQIWRHYSSNKCNSIMNCYRLSLGFPCSSASKESACNAGDLGLIPGLGRSPAEGKAYPLQHYGLENSMACSPWGLNESNTMEQLSLSQVITKLIIMKLHMRYYYWSFSSIKIQETLPGKHLFPESCVKPCS